MNNNQFFQADLEESIRQRWENFYFHGIQTIDGSKVAIKLIAWNTKINKEIESQQKKSKLSNKKKEN